ncbi:ABC transporter substrate-binding protein [Nonomuraea lactucae]|uniref:ABC transporter substrate-binding protein n=1 Tax=Nonomuraea lactucae TaxID=2249762 RepID=UPI000DE41992|nr:ABC transporter substrate-binding protein [Nonomuraea lactucae]
MRIARLTVALTTGLALVTACGGTDGGKSDGADAGGGPETIVFALAGLGPEGEATQAAIKDFERANPSIKVEVQVLSTDATQYLQQLQHRFVAGSGTPDVFKVDGIYPASLAKAGWLLDLDTLKPDLGAFMPSSLTAGRYQGKTYAVPWFINTEGLFYRTDLVKVPPKTPEELVAAAQAAMKANPKVKYGLAFEGAKYEGAITAFLAMAGGFGGKLDPANLDTPENRRALRFMRDSIHQTKIAPQAVTGWKEGEVQQAFSSGQAVFALNWPFVFSASEGMPAAGKIGFAPFAGTGATLGAEMLAINGKSAHTAASWKLIQHLTSADVQVKRALATGNPPSVTAAYNETLFAEAPYFKQVQKVAEVAVQRPVATNYPKISDRLQTMLSSVLSNLTPPEQALTTAASEVRDIAANG